MEEKLIRNRDHLLGDHSLPSRYRNTSRQAIKAETTPPDGPVMNLPRRGSVEKDLIQAIEEKD
jgi:hypothetical protein